MARNIDLHTHSKYSDGILAPSDLVKKAGELSVAAMALTDHDTVAGLKEMVEAGAEFSVEVIPGIELSCYVGEQEYHILGYFIDYTDKVFVDRLNKIQEGRVQRAKEVVDKLNGLGFKVSFEEVKKLAGGSIGKPHLAMAVINNPQNESKFKEEFGDTPTSGMFIQSYFSVGTPAYVAKEGFHPVEAIKEIKRLGGLSSLAHPGWEMADITEPKNVKYADSYLIELKEAGLDAIEVYAHYDDPDLTSEVMEHFQKRADELDLLTTGGSDYHGFGSAGMELGFSNFFLKVPYEVLESLKAKLIS